MAAPPLHSLLALPLTGVRTATEVPIPATTPTLLLTRRLAKGDEAAFREFHALYFDRLYQFLLVVSRGQQQEAEEALQETFLRVSRYVRAFEADAAFWCWLKVVARSTARDAGRKRSRYLALLESFALRWRDQPVQQVSDEDDRLHEVLEKTLEELHPQNRLLI